VKKIVCLVVCIVSSVVCSMDNLTIQNPTPHKVTTKKGRLSFDADPIQTGNFGFKSSPEHQRVRSQSQENSRFKREENFGLSKKENILETDKSKK
jgi:hypothetical protein